MAKIQSSVEYLNSERLNAEIKYDMRELAILSAWIVQAFDIVLRKSEPQKSGIVEGMVDFAKRSTAMLNCDFVAFFNELRQQQTLSDNDKLAEPYQS